MTEPQPKRRRRRPAVSRKQRCDRQTPCNNCVRANRENCVYEDHPPLPTSTEPCVSEDPPLQSQRQYSESSFASVLRPLGNSLALEGVSDLSSSTTRPGSPNAQAAISQPSAATASNDITTRHREPSGAEVVPASLLAVNAEYNASTATSGAAELSSTKDQDDLFGRPQVRGRLVIHKSRLFGQSHWMNGCYSFRDIFDLFESYLRKNPSSSSVLTKVETCKILGRAIKSNRVPAWPTTPTTDLPPKELADKLLDCYLSTYETVYRILHVPTFRKGYEALWMPGVQADMAFLVQVKLVLALGVEAFDDDNSLRDSAVRWVYEGQTWFSAPAFKSHLTLQSLQTKTLLLLAREKASVGADLVWISAGSLLRTAVYMGLHRDPAELPKRSLFAAEMRRRIWNTILEVTLQSSMTSGGPPMLSVDDFNTETPGNYDDEQLMEKDAVPQPKDTLTQMSVARALRKTFPIRLAVAKYLNDLRSHSHYEEMLKLDEEVRTSYKGLCRDLQQADRLTGAPRSQFAYGMVDFIMLRYISSLHIIFFERGLQGKTFAFSRSTLVDTLLKLWYSVYRPSSSLLGLANNTGDISSGPDYLQRLVVGRGCGFFRTIVFQAACIIAAEVRAQLREQESLTTVRPDLLAIVYEEKVQCLKSIEAGETNIKGYLYLSLVCTQLEMIKRGLKEEEHAELLVKSAEEALDKVLPILEEKAGQTRCQDETDPLDPFSLVTPADFGEEWDFMVSAAL
ncbi:hypothetical protein LTR10_022164 [Elasticomyces elasticus]|uniref:Xylanolytic transcriptional activator regulatory domain-containing protein n=1 Tax=Exophiala sideris TaxID=1016849 RepID=A0ABR0IWS9_9EURO|nr:hypothetical protein LTR10_022164 [Elasticomyces elasticus]KAK5023779.1 hypothetical protein LTR13_011088 [Exophiala sideris]KAK5048858.1 hypothetical protein LTR69_011203 [Exophiala sideris]